MEKNYFFQEKTALEPKRKTINFILNYSKSIKVQKQLWVSLFLS